MALVFRNNVRKVASTDLSSADGKNIPRKLVVPVEPEGDPSHTLHPAIFECNLHLASNNSDNVKKYAAYIKGVFIGHIETAGGLHTACRAHVPKDYNNLMSESRITPTGMTLRDGAYLLCKHADIIPNTPRSPNKNAKVCIPA